jgi:transcriptional regulator with XRE-family HTH domain
VVINSQKLESRPRALRHAIVDSELTQRRLARRVRIDETRLSRIVSGQISPTDREARSIAKALGVTVDEVFAVREAVAS